MRLHKAKGQAVFGHVRDTVADGVAVGPLLHGLPIDLDQTSIGPRHAKQGMAKLGPPCADQPGQAKHFARPDGKADVLIFTGAGQPRHLQHRSIGRQVAGHNLAGKGFAGHQLGQPRLGHASGRIDADQFAVAQHRDTGRDVQHLSQPVTDKHHRHPTRRQGAHHRQQRIGFRLGQRGRRFIHENQLRVRRQRAGDGHQLPLGNGQRVQPDIQIDIDMQQRHHPLRGLSHRPVADHARAIAQQLFKRDVFGNSHFAKQGKVLPNHGNAMAAGRVGRDIGFQLAGIFHHRARFGHIDAGDDLDQRALAAAIFAGQTVNFAASDLEIDIIQRLHVAEHF